MTVATPEAPGLVGGMARERADPAAVARCRRALETLLPEDCDFSDAARALYAVDASNYRQVPLGVVRPRDADDVVAVTALCREHGLPVLMRGGGTSQNGQCVNVAVVLDCSRHLHRVLEIDVESRTALVEPGVVCDALKAAAEPFGLTFGPDPATHSRCTLGGMIGNNSCGPHSMLAGKTVENVVALEILTPCGARFWTGPTDDEELTRILAVGDRRSVIYAELLALRDEHAARIRERFPTIKRRVSGFNLDQLLPENGFDVARALVGSEGTCVSILRARVRLIENPAHKRLFVLGFADIFMAGDAVPEILPHAPIAMEGIDWNIVGGLIARELKRDEVALLPEGRAWLMTEIAAPDAATLTARCTAFAGAMQASSRVLAVDEVTDAATVAALWSIREQGASATSMSLDPTGPDPVVGWEDTAVDPLRLGDYLRAFQALIDRHGYTTSLYGHFGDGCIHARITFDTRSTDGVATWRAFSREIAALVVRFGGSLSGEHGDGQAKAEFLPLMYGEALVDAFTRFKRAWDPDARMNPGKVVEPYRMDENLRFGPDYATPAVTTALSFVEDVGGFGRTTERCIGMGKCRAATGAMCPSFQATGEEGYSTRGRAHLLHELVRGEILENGWQDANIADSLEHCLSCKACKRECPTQVDIASWKAEFMARHWAGRRRPVHHRAFGHLGTTLPRLAPYAGIVNALQRSPLGALAKRTLGIAPDTTLPALAREPFARRVVRLADGGDAHFHRIASTRGDRTRRGAPVVLWADSVNAHYRPDVLESAIRVLGADGSDVLVARDRFCCGRPLYEYGYLDRARAQLGAILDGFHAALPADAHVVVLEPSCLSVFRDELLRLFPADARAADLATRAMTLTSHLSARGVEPSRRLARGMLHLHCHDKSLGRPTDDRVWMSRCFDEIVEPESGCCGMAGTFGMRSATRSIGQTLFARRLAPAIAAAERDTVVVANGFSCREQIHAGSGRESLHPVQVIERCLQAPDERDARTAHDPLAGLQR